MFCCKGTTDLICAFNSSKALICQQLFFPLFLLSVLFLVKSRRLNREMSRDQSNIFHIGT